MRDRLVGSSGFRRADAEIAQDRWIVRTHDTRALEQCDRFVESLQPAERLRKIADGLEVIGLQLKARRKVSTASSRRSSSTSTFPRSLRASAEGCSEPLSQRLGRHRASAAICANVRPSSCAASGNVARSAAALSAAIDSSVRPICFSNTPRLYCASTRSGWSAIAWRKASMD